MHLRINVKFRFKKYDEVLQGLFLDPNRFRCFYCITCQTIPLHFRDIFMFIDTQVTRGRKKRKGKIDRKRTRALNYVYIDKWEKKSPWRMYFRRVEVVCFLCNITFRYKRKKLYYEILHLFPHNFYFFLLQRGKARN